MKILRCALSELQDINLPFFPPQRYCSKRILDSIMMESWEHCIFSLFYSSKGLRLMGLTGCCWSYWVHHDGSYSFCSACPSLHSLLCLFSFTTPLFFSAPISLWRMQLASGPFCPGLFLDVMLWMREIRLKNRRREKERHFPVAYGSRKLKSFHSIKKKKKKLSKKGQFVTKAQTYW